MPDNGTHLWKKNKYGHWTRITDDNTGYVEIKYSYDNINVLSTMPKVKRKYGSWVKTKSDNDIINITIYAQEEYLQDIYYEANKLINGKE
jgi:hypothetical protein